ncbi:MAG: HipA domain-containing protein [Cyclobacteriaceae bacterium]
MNYAFIHVYTLSGIFYYIFISNVSLIKNDQGQYELAPAYDLVALALVVEGDDEELALTLCDKKKRLKKSDFFSAMTSSGIPDKAAENILNKYAKLPKKWLDLFNQSFLSKKMMEQYRQLILLKHNQLFS